VSVRRAAAAALISTPYTIFWWARASARRALGSVKVNRK
jgi:hypothetical protein